MVALWNNAGSCDCSGVFVTDVDVLMKNEMYDVAVVGAGPSGMMAAIQAKRNGASVLLLERNAEVGKKLLTTGNGRCNFTNGDMDPQYFHTTSNRALLEHVLTAFSLKDTLAFFSDIGTLPKQRFGTGYYPNSMQASSVRDALLFCLREPGITLVTGATVRRVTREPDSFCMTTDEGQSFFSKRLVLSTGGNAVPKSGSDGTGFKIAKRLGHTLVPVRPALLPLTSDEPFWKALSGVRVEGKVNLTVADPLMASNLEYPPVKDRTVSSTGEHPPVKVGMVSSTDEHPPVKLGTVSSTGERPPMKVGTVSSFGELQFTKNGISGIPVFDVSRFYTEGCAVSLCFLPELTKEEIRRELGRRFPEAGKETQDSSEIFSRAGEGVREPSKWFTGENAVLQNGIHLTAREALNGLFPAKLIPVLLQKADIVEAAPAGTVTPEECDRLLAAITDFRVRVTGTMGFADAQVTAGGIPLQEVNTDLSSAVCPGLYLTGELLDVDGKCGGYNLQWAWSTGAVAGRSAAGQRYSS